MRGYVRAAVRHPAALMVTGVLVAFLAFSLLLQGRVLPLTVLLVMGAIARLATDNMTVVFLSALTACGLYLVLLPRMMRAAGRGREGLVGDAAAKKEEEEAAAAAAPQTDAADAASPPPPPPAATEEQVVEPEAPTLVEQKIAALQTRVDAVQAELDAAAAVKKQ